jgi:hypothetical protein
VGLLRWIRGGDEDSTSTAMMSAGLAEIAGVFQPTRHKQTEHIDESQRRRLDVGSGAGTGVDLERGVAVIRRGARPAPAADRADSGHVGSGPIEADLVDSDDLADAAETGPGAPRR